MFASNARARILSAQTRTLIGAEIGIRTIVPCTADVRFGS